MDELNDDLPSRPRWRVVLDWVGPVVIALVLWQGLGKLRAPDLPEVAPPVQVTTVDGAVVSLEQLRGQTVVLNFWATWCGPCKLEAPSFSAFADANPDVVVLGLAEDRDPALVRRTAERLGITYPVASAPRELLVAYGIGSFPTTVVVGPDGRVKTAHVGLLTRPQLWWMTR